MRWLRRAGDAAESDTRFGFAVVGLGHGAHKFIEAVQGSASVRVAALISGDAAKADQMARRHRVPLAGSYGQLDQVLQSPAIDAVYLCLPNALHREFAERAARAGKHVLCEKPMAPTPVDCRAMIEACRAAGVRLMTAYRPEFSSVHQRAREMLATGRLGRVQTVRSGFGFIAKPGWRLDPALAGGGSLFDVGIYSAHAIYQLFDEPFTLCSASLQRDPRTRLELAAQWSAALASGAEIQCRSSYLERIPDFLEVSAEHAVLRLEPAFSYSGLRVRVIAKPGADPKLDLDMPTPRAEPSTFRLEAEHLAECVRTGAPLLASGESGLRDVETLCQIETLAERG
jgi:predicted dehydrogenase